MFLSSPSLLFPRGDYLLFTPSSFSRSTLVRNTIFRFRSAASADGSKSACLSIEALAKPVNIVTSITTNSSSTGICYDDFKIHDANTIMLDKELTYKKQLRITEHPNTLTDYTVSITITGSASRLRITCNTLRVKP